MLLEAQIFHQCNSGSEDAETIGLLTLVVPDRVQKSVHGGIKIRALEPLVGGGLVGCVNKSQSVDKIHNY